MFEDLNIVDVGGSAPLKAEWSVAGWQRGNDEGTPGSITHAHVGVRLLNKRPT